MYFSRAMDWEKIDLKHKQLLYDKLKAITVPLSEFSFANLYLFRHIHKYEVAENEGDVFVRGATYDGSTFYLPTKDIREYDRETLLEMQKDVDFFFPIPQEWSVSFDMDEAEQTNDEGDSDYIYTVEKMCTYKGRKLHKKRNLLKQFRQNYEHMAFPMVGDHVQTAKQILEDWQEGSGQAKEDTDYHACCEALKLNKELNLCGLVYYADEEPAGFVLGEELNRHTFVIHFAKGLVDFKGVYQFLFNNFAKILPERYTYLNFEQDLGKTALRMAKSSYIPDQMLKKYRLRLK
ncbi:DUF2156 domain-containing protein [Limisalsivibrio acetivorans]|uniref:DUF2156 domain-containing protein n=1 Tax=Limisalsivibrio acetivorans TaxID=1304888 RepID=UPI0003B754B5|nr:phosphatidylglycerol lysyltransferase domain-containing protein [Limisalsivibrio acetivorans]